MQARNFRTCNGLLAIRRIITSSNDMDASRNIYTGGDINNMNTINTITHRKDGDLWEKT